jgi:hypothetical protein
MSNIALDKLLHRDGNARANSGSGQLREWGRPAERVRKTPNKRQFRCGAEDARLVPLNETAHAVACGNDPSASGVETWESEG